MKEKIITIIGGYGNTGEVVANILSTKTEHKIIIAGRDVEKAQKLANQLGKNTKAVQLNIFDQVQLKNICHASDIIVNCAGPTVKIKDTVGRVAVQEGCNFIEVGGYDYITKEFRSQNSQLIDNKLSYVLSSGWIPGMAEILPYYSDLRANEIFDKKESLFFYCGDRNNWSETGLLDTVRYSKKNSLEFMKIVKAGKIRNSMGIMKSFNLPFGINKQLGCLHLSSELKTFALNHAEYSNIRGYLTLFGWSTFLTFMKITYFMHSDKKCMKAIANAYRKEVDEKGKLGLSMVEITGWKDGKRKKLQTTMISEGGYYLTGVGCAATVLVLLKNKLKAGINYMPEAIDTMEYVSILNDLGIKIFENIEG